MTATQAITISGPELLLGPMSEFTALTQLWPLQITPKAERIELFRFDHTLHWLEHYRGIGPWGSASAALWRAGPTPPRASQ